MARDSNTVALLTVDEVADALKLSVRTIRRRIATGELPVVRTGGPRTAIRIERDALDHLLKGTHA